MNVNNNSDKNLTGRDEFGRFVKGVVPHNKGIYIIPREMILCKCGCGEKLISYDKWKNKLEYKKGHGTPKKGKRVILCACNCGGLLLTPNNSGKKLRYIKGHHNRRVRDKIYGYNIFPKLIPAVQCACPCKEWMELKITNGVQQKFKLGHNFKSPDHIPWSLGKTLTYEQKKHNIGHHRCKGQKRTEEQKLRIKLGMIGRKSPSKESRMKMSEAHSKIITPKHDTSIEIKVQNALIDLNIPFKKHKVFKVGEKFHQVDVFIQPDICIECDGDYYHSLLCNINRDYKIDYELEKQGMKVIRLWEYDIKKNLDWCISLIISIQKR